MIFIHLIRVIRMVPTIRIDTLVIEIVKLVYVWTNNHSFHLFVAIFLVKGVNYYGPNSEFIVSGSDCGNVFFWEHDSEKICQVKEADETGVVSSFLSFWFYAFEWVYFRLTYWNRIHMRRYSRRQVSIMMWRYGCHRMKILVSTMIMWQNWRKRMHDYDRVIDEIPIRMPILSILCCDALFG